MPKISTARETLARINKRIAEEPNPKHKAWIQTNTDHWWGEVIGDVDMVMRTLSNGPIRYSYDGHPFMWPEIAVPDSREAARQMYEAIQAAGARAAGPFDDERFFFDVDRMYVQGILTCVFPGFFITNPPEPIDPDGLYMVRNLNCAVVKFDEHGLMMGEEIINGAPISIQRVGPEMIQRLIDGPTPE